MAKPSKRKVPGESGRVTPKGGVQRVRQTESLSAGPSKDRPSASTRYTPPTPVKTTVAGVDQRFVPMVMLGFLIAGLLMIVTNYLSDPEGLALLPGAPSNWYIFGGLGLILGGILVATQWR